ncbi:hypothetical protein SLEP1_g48403 [Rubroshorea leprosula]|uniref:Uncharacterized protein n=1 Tax=Rubroshorea leprosula TaxID=152421 RepID=A0AAV5LUG0_9ROSI|nr:hypothetical protein SLEP1_g48403 [Rubroshorea leprosula]
MISLCIIPSSLPSRSKYPPCLLGIQSYRSIALNPVVIRSPKKTSFASIQSSMTMFHLPSYPFPV